MKKNYIILLVSLGAAFSVDAQTTNYGAFSGTLGNHNSYFGFKAGFLVNGNHNSYVGSNAAIFLGTGSENSGLGSHTFHSITNGSGNSAVGFKTLYYNTEGALNSAVGSLSMYSNTKGLYNSAFGAYSLHLNTTGNQNASFGFNSMHKNNTGFHNTAAGSEAMYNNADGFENTAVGRQALYTNGRGVQNVAIGAYALFDAVGSFNTAVGVGAGVAKPSFNKATAIGYNAKALGDNEVQIGDAGIYSIGGYKPWTVVSDGRFKRDVRADVSGLEFINQLRPVSYVLDKQAIDKFLGLQDNLTSNNAQSKTIPERQTGFIAQEVEAIVKKSGYVFSGVKVPQNENDHYGIRYSEFVVPLVKAVQELTAKLESQQEEIILLKQQLVNPSRTAANGIETVATAVLFQNNPNPFSVDTDIKISLPENTRQARLIVYNMEGKQLKEYPLNERGDISVKIFANELAAGIYLYALITDGKVVDTKRLLLTK